MGNAVESLVVVEEIKGESTSKSLTGSAEKSSKKLTLSTSSEQPQEFFPQEEFVIDLTSKSKLQVILSTYNSDASKQEIAD